MTKFITGLSGYHVLVTGGTKGIGKTVVEAFLAEGSNVSYCARTVRGDEFANFNDAADGARAVGTSVDITNLAAIDRWVQDAAAEFGKVNVVVANAPAGTGTGIETWRRNFEGDILGLITLIEAATPHLAAQAGAASVIVVSSLAGFELRHQDVAGPYTTLKRAQATLARDFGRKLMAQGVRINTLVPGIIDTPNITLPDGTVELSQYNKARAEAPEAVAQAEQMIALKRLGRPEEVSNTVLFLASQLSGYIAGANVLIDGGISLSL